MLRSSLLTLTLIFLWLLLFEGAARLWIQYENKPFQQSLRLLQADSKYGWKQRDQLHTEFYKSKVITNSNGFRTTNELQDFSSATDLILTYGPSSAFGWAVEDAQTYSSLLAKKLEVTKRRLQSLNLSQIGYSSYQGYLLSQDPTIAKLRPATVIISYGVNDVDRYRFFFSSLISDADQFPLNQELASSVNLLNLIHRSAFLRTINEIVGMASLNLSCEVLQKPPQRRLSLAQSKLYFSKLIEKSKAQGAEVVLVTTPHLYPSTTGTTTSYEDLYRPIQEAAVRKDCRGAKKRLEKARPFEQDIITKDIRELNVMLRSLANTSGSQLVDAEKLLSNAEDFVDPIHPSVKGHERIAKNIFEVLSKRSPE